MDGDITIDAPLNESHLSSIWPKSGEGWRPLFLHLRAGKGEHAMVREDPRLVVRPVCSHCSFKVVAYLLRRRVAPVPPLDLLVEWRPWESGVRWQRNGSEAVS